MCVTKIGVKSFFDEHDIHKYFVRARVPKFLLYLTKDNCPDISDYPNLKAHLENFKKIMLNRRETKKGLNKWFHLHWPRVDSYFENPKIVLPAMFDKPIAAFQRDSGYFGLSSNVVCRKTKKYELKFLLAILNSCFAAYWFYKYGKRRGVGVDIGVGKLREFPIKKTAPEKQIEFINIVDKILAITKDADYLANSIKQAQVKKYEKQIDQMVFELYGMYDEDIRIVEGEGK